MGADRPARGRARALGVPAPDARYPARARVRLRHAAAAHGRRDHGGPGGRLERLAGLLRLEARAGSAELLIGYNAFRLADKTLRYPDVIDRNLDPETLRYKRRRVSGDQGPP